MNIRNLNSLLSATYDASEGNTSDFLIGKPGENKSIAIYAVTNHTSYNLFVREAESSGSQTQNNPKIILPAASVISFDAPIILGANKGVALTQYGSVLYQIINNTVSTGSYS